MNENNLKEFFKIALATCDYCEHFEEGCWCNQHKITIPHKTPACVEYAKKQRETRN